MRFYCCNKHNHRVFQHPKYDPMFAYRATRSVDNAVNMALHYTLQHLDSPGTYARILFVNFSSAFNSNTGGSQTSCLTGSSTWCWGNMSLNSTPSALILPKPAFLFPCSFPSSPTVASPVTSPSSSWSLWTTPRSLGSSGDEYAYMWEMTI